MFEYLKDYQYIFVSGMQRTGTTICMRMIQWDLEIPRCYCIGGERKTATTIINSASKNQFVMHSPGISRWIHEIANEENTAVIWMKRDLGDVIKSAQRINWSPAENLRPYNIPRTGIFEEDILNLLEVKTKFWEETQRPLIKNWYEIEYESLITHPLWFHKIHRELFTKDDMITSPGIRKSTRNRRNDGSLESLLKEFPK